MVFIRIYVWIDFPASKNLEGFFCKGPDKWIVKTFLAIWSLSKSPTGYHRKAAIDNMSVIEPGCIANKTFIYKKKN